MRKFLPSLWLVVTFPFRLIWWILNLPVRAYKKAHAFLTFEPEDRPVTEALVDTLQKPSALLEHIEALRKHLFRILIGVAIAIALFFAITPQMVGFLAKPVGGINALKAIDVTESIGVFMRVALLGGITLASPYIAFEFWLFAAQGIKARSRRMGLVGIPLATILFVGGMAFAYYAMLPTALPFLLSFMGIQTIPRPSSYIAFEFPLVIFVLTLMGIAKPRFLAQQWRLAVVLIAVLAAAITPTVDPINMSLVMAPMIMLYFLSIGLSYLASIGRKKKPADVKT